MGLDGISEKARRASRPIIFLIQLVLFACLFLLFFEWFAIDNPQIMTVSRTAAITMTTFVVLGITMTKVYGGFAVGKKKSKEIIPSLCIASFITDFVTYFQLSIMNVNRYNQARLIFQDLGIFLLVVVMQCIAVTLFVYLGNHVYFKINPPENCVIICDDIQKATDIMTKINRYKKQFKVTDIISYSSENLKERIRHSDSVFIYNVPADYKNEIIEYAYKHFTTIYTATELSDVILNHAKPMMLDDLSILESANRGLTFEQKLLKRTMDLVISGIGIVVLSPVMLIIALAIKLNDGGPVFFKQKRATMNGREFDVLKFRTMIVDADTIEGYRPASDGDDRITKVGKLLRKLRVDELPQLINILKGDMSVVGPRPERIEHVELYTNELPEFSYRLRVKAGLTGLAQIVGKYNTSPKDKLILDLMYIEKYNVWLDIMLIFQTIAVFFKSDSTEGFSDEKMLEFVKLQSEKSSKEDNKKQ